MPIPFMADFEEKRVDKRRQPPSVRRRQGSLARDGAGRVRQDFTLELEGQEPLPLATLSDPETGRFVLLDARTSRPLRQLAPAVEAALKDVFLERAAGLGLELAPPAGLSAEATARQRIGEGTIEGLTCLVVRQASEGGESSATWFAHGLGEVVRRQRRGPEEDYDYRLFHIRLADPPASLFVVKEDGP